MRKPMHPVLWWAMFILLMLPMIVLGMADADHRYSSWLRRMAYRRAAAVGLWEMNR